MKFSERFEQQKLQEINKLEKVNSFVKEVLEKNQIADLMNIEMTQKLEKIITKNNKLLHKLKSNEFEIAVVGLEKAGKSTFVNALIENDILPSAPERCTYTATKLSYGDDKAIVEFYTEEKFDEIFRTLLRDIEYPEWEKQSYKTLSIDAFQNYFDSLEEKNPSLYKEHIGITDEEVLEILRQKNKLILNGGIKEFNSEELNSDIFKSYIKGENKGEDTSKPRSTKRVEIYSNNLNKLETAIIYDVPGFDSPTKIHKRQTLERLQNADAIILVTNAGRNPSLQGTQLNTITKNSDVDNIPLRDKLFVFGNQIDLVNKENDIKSNKDILIKDVLKYNIGTKKRVFVGSAYKYSVDKKIVDDKEFTTKFEFDNSGIEDLYKELINYYENDRFEILQRKIETNQQNIEEIFEELLKQQTEIADKDFVEIEKTKIQRQTQKKIERELKDSLNELKQKLKKEIQVEEYFSKKFVENIDNGDFFQEIDENEIEYIHTKNDVSIRFKDIPVNRINDNTRKELHKKFLKKYTNLIVEITDEKSKEIENMILQTFIKAIVGDSVLDITKDAKKIISQISKNESHDKNKFTYLIERFSRDVFDIISYPIGSLDRKDKFINAKKEFIYLDEFYGGNGNLISLLLSGKKQNQNIMKLPSTILDILDFYVSIQISPVNLPMRIKEIKNKAQNLKKLLSNTIENNSKDINIEEILKDIKISKTKEEVLEEINNDIRNLKDILKKAVVPATNLELAFSNAIDKQIQVIISAIDSIDDEFDTFIAKVVNKLKENEIKALTNQLEIIKLKKEILKLIKEFKG